MAVRTEEFGSFFGALTIIERMRARSKHFPLFSLPHPFTLLQKFFLSRDSYAVLCAVAWLIFSIRFDAMSRDSFADGTDTSVLL